MSILMLMIFVAALAHLMAERLKTLLTYFQQEEYDGARFLRACLAMRLYDLRATALICAGVLAVRLGLPLNLGLLMLAGGFWAIAYFERQYKYKKPLAMTQRAQRIYFLAQALMVLAVVLVIFGIFWAVVVVQLAPLMLALANRILAPFQTRVNKRYITEAEAKLARINPTRIGITGSFGKTTVKHILADVLAASGPVFYSRGSINTVLGLTRHIRQRLQWSHRYFIAEMGAYGQGSVQRLCDFARPDHGIITAVGDAHTERFGSIDAIALAKSELAQDVCRRGGMVVLNADVLRHAPFAQLRADHPAQMISVGPEGADVTVEATKGPGGIWQIFLHSAAGVVPDLRYDLPLLGDHNVMNSALAVVMTVLIDPDVAPQIGHFTQAVAQIPHRLQKIETPGQALILDDAYNANEKGFVAAVDTLRALATERGGRAVLVTPGIAELGPEHDAVHARLGAHCRDKCDLVVVVAPARIGAFTGALGDARVQTVASFAQARALVTQQIAPADVVLYENDLPDVLEEKRLL